MCISLDPSGTRKFSVILESLNIQNNVGSFRYRKISKTFTVASSRLSNTRPLSSLITRLYESRMYIGKQFSYKIIATF